MRIVSDKFIDDLKEVLRDSEITHFDDCAQADYLGEPCDCGGDLLTVKLKKLRTALNNDDSFKYAGATH